MSTRQLGKNGPQVSAIGSGAIVLSVGSGITEPEDKRFKLYDRAIELGCTFFDSGDVYGDSEDSLGRYFEKYPHQREKVFLGTKFALAMSPELKTYIVRGDAQYVHEACEKSLKRLGLNSIDLYYAHCIDKTVPIEETVGAMKELVNAGKVKYLGLSNCSSDTLRRAHVVHPIACIQIEYSPFSLDIERDEIGLLKTCRELGVAIVCYAPLSRGILGGKIKSLDDLEENDFRRRFPRFDKENLSKNLQLTETLAELARKKGCTPSQLTLAWILAQGDDFIPIPSTTKIKNLEENLAAVQIKLTEEELQEIRQVCENAEIAGESCPKNMSGFLFADSAPKPT
ncbi:unnamed protein product [Rotaria sordida]|uniref:NADP-dependent oxidoreductase domain-containing protein n=1 Tax=Rotaria sordida TaxID=392033 RepID=A0A814VM29_9BILA|nr:unnamed protein product [Rotaria sordida]CAF3846408.1 unnamed protein product [Rotaria sordida]